MITTSVLVVVGVVLYLLFYHLYGRTLEKGLVKADSEALTPARRLYDGMDFVPANKYVLFGHHFASIAGAAPIVGPAIAMAWGWLPAILWVWFGNILIGSVHDYLSLMASVRHDGKSIPWIAGKLLTKRTGVLFQIFILFTLILVVAAFASVISQIFLKSPPVATASLLFIGTALITGWLLYKVKLGFGPSTIVGIILIGLSIAVAPKFPIVLSRTEWIMVLFVYIVIASSLPVWVLLQPRDYLNAYILWGGLALGGIALVIAMHRITSPAFTMWSAPVIGGKPSPFWPTIPLIIACGSLSGFHSIVASGTTSKQLANERDGLFVGFGGMYTEGFLSTVVVVSIAAFGLGVLGKDFVNSVDFAKGYGHWINGVGGPIGIFSRSYAQATHLALRLPLEAMAVFASLWVAAFTLTTLDTVDRLGRFVWTELMEPFKSKGLLYNVLTNKWFASFLVAALGIWMAIGGAWKIIWPAFGGANQMLASIALFTVSTWVVKHLTSSTWYRLAVLLPALFLWITVTSALFWYLLAVIPEYRVTNPGQAIFLALIIVVEIALNLLLAYEFFKVLSKKETYREVRGE